jgi:transcriptional antiterminator Rof (Rho-off)
MEAFLMPAKNPRINVVIEDPLYQNVLNLAERDGVSLSTKVRDLLKEALEIEEDLHLAALAEKREDSLDATSPLSHDEVWS